MMSNRVRVGSRVMLLGMSNLSPSSPCPVGPELPNAAARLSCAHHNTPIQPDATILYTRVWAAKSESRPQSNLLQPKNRSPS